MQNFLPLIILAIATSILLFWIINSSHKGAPKHNKTRSPDVQEMIAVGKSAEAAVEKYFTDAMFHSLVCKLPGGQGFDHVFVRWRDGHRHFLIVETKANKSRLVGDQMSDAWIERKLQQMERNGDHEDGQLHCTAQLLNFSNWLDNAITTHPVPFTHYDLSLIE